MLYKGSCHCGSINFRVEAPEVPEVNECNCSICTKSGYLHLIVPKSKFELINGKDHLVEYTFNTGVAKHLFCKRCGIKSFYIPRSNPDGYSINVRCLDPQPQSVKIEKFDGVHWEENADKLSHLTNPGSE